RETGYLSQTFIADGEITQSMKGLENLRETLAHIQVLRSMVRTPFLWPLCYEDQAQLSNHPLDLDEGTAPRLQVAADTPQHHAVLLQIASLGSFLSRPLPRLNGSTPVSRKRLQ